MPSSTEAMVSLVVVTANMPSRRARAGTGSIAKVKGSMIANPTNPERPGIAPSWSPIKTPRNMYPMAGQATTDSSPLKAASNMSASRREGPDDLSAASVLGRRGRASTIPDSRIP